ncbi:hypothetical protein HDU98_008071 [Podochytrium sp. JEL0797]|nr:hypothetical protein HDU98_008071 [Podochytrium sp. JEL0797]
MAKPSTPTKTRLTLKPIGTFMIRHRDGLVQNGKSKMHGDDIELTVVGGNARVTQALIGGSIQDLHLEKWKSSFTEQSGAIELHPVGSGVFHVFLFNKNEESREFLQRLSNEKHEWLTEDVLEKYVEWLVEFNATKTLPQKIETKSEPIEIDDDIIEQDHDSNHVNSKASATPVMESPTELNDLFIQHAIHESTLLAAPSASSSSLSLRASISDLYQPPVADAFDSLGITSPTANEPRPKSPSPSYPLDTPTRAEDPIEIDKSPTAPPQRLQSLKQPRVSKLQQTKPQVTSIQNPLVALSRTTKKEEYANEVILVYPATGVNLVTLHKQDLLRLEEGEFLNDTLIEFYIRYTTITYAVDFTEKYHMYNTFFYQTITTKDDSAKKLVIADTFTKVKRWTRKLDIFDRKLLILPINERLHWYLAVIWNPGAILEPVEEEEEDCRFHDASDGEKKEAVHLADDSEPEIAGTPTWPLFSKGSGSKKGGKQGVDVDDGKCKIFIFDSLGGKHPTVGRNLYAYLEAEARDKKAGRRVVVEPPKVYYGKVQDQLNYCDCGLFLLHYITTVLRTPRLVAETVIKGEPMNTPQFGSLLEIRAMRHFMKRKIHQLEWNAQQALASAAETAAAATAGDGGSV